MIIKLTHIRGKDIFVNVRNILYFNEFEKGTTITLAENIQVDVSESVDRVMQIIDYEVSQNVK